MALDADFRTATPSSCSRTLSSKNGRANRIAAVVLLMLWGIDDANGKGLKIKGAATCTISPLRFFFTWKMSEAGSPDAQLLSLSLLPLCLSLSSVTSYGSMWLGSSPAEEVVNRNLTAALSFSLAQHFHLSFHRRGPFR